MRWAQTRQMLKSDGVNARDMKSLFKVYETEEELKADLCDKTKFVKWVTYPNAQVNAKFELDRRAQRKYEVLCGGFLLYHDKVFKKYGQQGGYEYPKPEKPGRDAKWKDYPDTYEGFDGKIYKSKDFEHRIYFEWFPKRGHENKKNKVIIYITPTPAPLNSVPPRPPAPPPPES